jgi:hypothetical protein
MGLARLVDPSRRPILARLQEQIWEAEERRAALAAHGLPADVQYCRISTTRETPGHIRYEFAEVHPDGCIEVIEGGFSVPDGRPGWWRDYVLMDYCVADAPPSTVRLPPPYGSVTTGISTVDGRHVTSWKPLRATVRYGDSPVYAQMRWHPGGGESVELCGLERRHSAADRERAWRGRELFHGPDEDLRDWQACRIASGRTPESGPRFEISKADVFEAYYQLQHAEDADPSHEPENERPEYVEVAERLCKMKQTVFGHKTLERRVREDWGRHWPPAEWPEWPEWERWRMQSPHDADPRVSGVSGAFGGIGDL